MSWTTSAAAAVRSGPPGADVYVLATATAVGSMGLAAGGSAGALLAVEMTGSEAAAGVPLGTLVAGSALGALLIGWTSNRIGRARGLILGYLLGVAGAVAVTVAAVVGSFPLVLGGSAVLGVANVAVFLSRYAVADPGDGRTRGREMGIVLAGAAVGAVAAPNLLGVSGKLAVYLGLPRLTGLYLVAVPAFLIAGCLLSLLRPPSVEAPPRVPLELGRSGVHGTRNAVLLLAITNLVMVAVMAIAPVHMTGHGHELDLVGVVVSVHVLCMFAPAPVTGWLTDRIGGTRVVGAGFVLLILSGVAGALVDPHSATGLVVALALLGLGWNAGVVAASMMLVASVRAADRTRVEGVGEVAMGLAAGAGAPIAGVITAHGGFETLAVVTAATALLALALLSTRSSPRR